jgi:UDP-N-acetylglucosamine 4-epimerase
MEETDKAIDLNYIENIVQANILAALTIEPAALNQNYNVACGELITISEMTIFLMQKLGITTPLSAKLKFRQPIREKAEIPCSYISITKAMSLLNYQPCYSIKEGLEETLKISKTEYGTIISD